MIFDKVVDAEAETDVGLSNVIVVALPAVVTDVVTINFDKPESTLNVSCKPKPVLAASDVSMERLELT